MPCGVVDEYKDLQILGTAREQGTGPISIVKKKR